MVTFARLLTTIATIGLSAVSTASIAGTDGVSYQVTKVNDTALQFVVKGPPTLGYAAIGIGRAMAGSLMFIVKPSASNATVSLATASGHTQPSTYGSSTPILTSQRSTTNSTTFTVQFTCDECTSWGSGSLASYSSSDGKEVSFIVAQGPKTGPTKRQASSSTSTGIGFHGDNYGVYQVNLADNSSVSSTRHDDSKWWKAHAILVCVGFLGIYAVGIVFAAILTKVTGRIKIHFVIQTFGTIIGIIGVSFGFKAAGGALDSAHTRFGLFLFVLIFVQASLGTTQHLLYIKHVVSAPYLIVRFAHRFTGWFFLFGVIVNAGLGLNLVGVSDGGQIAWYVVMFALFIAYFGSVMVPRVLALLSPSPPADRSGNEVELAQHNKIAE